MAAELGQGLAAIVGHAHVVDAAPAGAVNLAGGGGQPVAGAAGAFVAGNRSFGAEQLSWVPRIVASEAGAAAGGTATLEAPAALAEADRVTRVGSTVVDAELELAIPAGAASGRYGSEITLTLFSRD